MARTAVPAKTRCIFGNQAAPSRKVLKSSSRADHSIQDFASGYMTPSPRGQPIPNQASAGGRARAEFCADLIPCNSWNRENGLPLPLWSN